MRVKNKSPTSKTIVLKRLLMKGLEIVPKYVVMKCCETQSASTTVFRVLVLLQIFVYTSILLLSEKYLTCISKSESVGVAHDGRTQHKVQWQLYYGSALTVHRRQRIPY